MSHQLDLNILIVEDNIDIAKMLKVCIAQEFGIDSFHAKNGQVALDYLEHTKPDLILLDLNLPVVNGWKVLEHGRKLYGEHGFNVIVTTASNDGVNRLVGKMQYVNNYISKPFVPDTIISVIREVMELDKL